MKVLSVHKVDSHYKVNVPCVNIATTVDFVCNLFPQIPNEEQKTPLKLKQKLVYKGYHMSDNRRKGDKYIKLDKGKQ